MRFFLILFSIITTVSISAQTWREIDSLNEPRLMHASVVLPNGSILVTGGGSDSTKSKCEIYNISENKWKYTAPLNIPRSNHSLILLNTGKVLAISGVEERSCELFNPINETWEMTDSTIGNRLQEHTITELMDGRILICGGFETVRTDTSIKFNNKSECNIYDPITEKWSIASNMNRARKLHSAVLLSDGRVLVMGGQPLTNSCEIYDPQTNTWTFAPSMQTARNSFASILLPNGKVFVSGGECGWNEGPPVTRNILNSCEVYDTITEKWTFVGNMNDYRSWHSLFLLEDLNKLLIFGGAAWKLTNEDNWEYYDLIELESVKNGLLPIKELYSKNSVQLINGNIVLIGGEQFDFFFDILMTWPTNLCFVFDIATEIVNNEKFTSEYFLAQNYPNPFNPSTKISFSIPRAENVALIVYDINGNEIKRLVNNDNLAAGCYSLEWNGTDMNGNKVASGIYFARMIAGNYQQTKKMNLVK